jgi:hypothetical protein
METVDIRPLKVKALKLRGPVKDLILSQPDTLEKNDYLAKAADWLKLIDFKEV